MGAPCSQRTRLTMAKTHACGNRMCWIVLTIIMSIVLFAGMGIMFGIEADCQEWSADSDAVLESFGSKGVQDQWEQCEAEKSDPESCNSDEYCTMESSGNDEAEIDVECGQCAAKKPYIGSSAKPKEKIRKTCDWMKKEFPNGYSSIDDNNSCASKGGSGMKEGGAFCQTAMKSEYDDCARWDKYPNGCCDKECQTIKQACKDDNATRAGQWLTGLLLIMIGIIFGSSFSCGICPICCCAKEKGPAVMPAQQGVVQAQAVVMAVPQPQVVMAQVQAAPIVMAQAQPVVQPMVQMK